MLFRGLHLTGIIDFDSTHVDFRAADVACARRSRHDDVVRGYLEASPLSNAELHCVGDLWKANVLRYALQLLHSAQGRDLSASELAWCAKQLEQTRPFDA
jgi:Ser/Thr protein kinase RdoA (MazF antagonist)